MDTLTAASAEKFKKVFLIIKTATEYAAVVADA